jgi:hypothetical protein
MTALDSLFTRAFQEWVKRDSLGWIGITSSFAFLRLHFLSSSFVLKLSTIV